MYPRMELESGPSSVTASGNLEQITYIFSLLFFVYKKSVISKYLLLGVRMRIK